MNVPQIELDEMTRSILSQPEYLECAFVIEKYESFGLEVSPDPFGFEIIEKIKKALIQGNAFSLIRIGDGEANILTNGVYLNTPGLNQFAAKRIVAMQNDSFMVGSLWLCILRDLMLGAILQADVVGVLGLWRPVSNSRTTESFAQHFKKDHRGISGHWRGIEYMLELAALGLLKDKVLSSAHIYFSLIENLRGLIELSNNVYIITNRQTVYVNLSRTYPNSKFHYIEIGCSSKKLLSDQPDFLQSVHDRLPADMTGTLSLIGAGPWAEIYCTWIKQRGGVALDIGSGMDLLDGRNTRPIHNLIDKEKLKNYVL